MTQQHMATWPKSPKRVRKKILTHAKDTPRSHTKRLSSPSRDLASLGIIMVRPSREIIYPVISTDINAKYYSIAHSHAWATGRIYAVLI